MSALRHRIAIRQRDDSRVAAATLPRLEWSVSAPCLPPMPDSDILIQGAREHNLRDVNLVLPRNRLICFTGRERVGQEFAGLRHPLCRGAAALRRKPVQLRPAVPGPDAQAGRRSDRRAEPVDLDLAEVRRAEPPLDGRHDHRDLRLSAGALCPGGQGALPAVRPADHRPDPRADHRADPGPAGGHAVPGAGPADPRPEGRVPRPVRGPAEAGLRPRPRRWPRGPADATICGWTARCGTTSRW